MFHVLLVLIPIVLLIIIGSILLFGIACIVAGIIGGTAATALIKNKTVKYLLLTAFCILLSVGSLCVFPFISLFVSFSAGIVEIVSVIILAFIGILSVLGIKVSNSIGKKIGRIISIIAFSIVGIFAITIAIFILALI